jgi:hypothetical protein
LPLQAWRAMILRNRAKGYALFTSLLLLARRTMRRMARGLRWATRAMRVCIEWLVTCPPNPPKAGNAGLYRVAFGQHQANPEAWRA